MLHFFIAIQGSGGARVSSEGHDRCPLYGLGKSYHRNDAERLGHLLVVKRVLAEHMVIGSHDNVISYVKLGPKALDFHQGRVKVMVSRFLQVFSSRLLLFFGYHCSRSPYNPLELPSEVSIKLFPLVLGSYSVLRESVTLIGFFSGDLKSLVGDATSCYG